MMKRLLRSVALKVLSFSEEDARVPPPYSAADQAFERRGQGLMAAKRAAAEPVTAGTIQLLGLEDIKHDLGAAWPRVSSLAWSLAEKVIRRHLTDSDIYTRQGDDAFVLFFAQKTVAEGAQIARAISAEIKDAMTRGIPKISQTVGVDHFVAEIPDEIIFEDDHAQPLADLLFDSLAEIRAEAERTLSERRTTLLRNARVVFRPIWNSNKRAVLLFRCMLDAVSGASTINHLASISEPDQLQSTMAELDLLVFGNAINSLHELLKREAKAILLIPVHFYTFANKLSADQYINLSQELPEPYRKFIFFELHGMPAGTPASRIEQICFSLRPFCHGVLLQATGANWDLGPSTTTAIKGISVDLADAPTDLSAWMKCAVTITRSRNLLSILHGANSIAYLQLGISAGFDYISGEAVHISLDEPRGAFRFTPPALVDELFAHAWANGFVDPRGEIDGES